jgi:hypothetical protein
MRQHVGVWAVAAAVLLASWGGTSRALAADVPEQPLQDWELEAITLARPSEAWLAVWQRQALQGEQADEQLRRAALLSRCPRVARHDAPFLVAELREAIEQVAERQRAMLARHEGPGLQRWLYGPALAAYRGLAAGERVRLLAAANSDAGRRARKWHSTLAVLELFPDHARAFDGQLEPARVVWLKAYLQAEGVWPAVLNTLKNLDAGVAQRWAALAAMPQLQPTDAEALRQLNQDVSALLPKATPALRNSLPSDERRVLQDLSAFWAAVADKAAMRWPAASAPPRPPNAPQPRPGDAPEPDAPVHAVPAALEEELLRTGPTHLAKDALPRVCPP